MSDDEKTRRIHTLEETLMAIENDVASVLRDDNERLKAGFPRVLRVEHHRRLDDVRDRIRSTLGV